ncbi:nagb/rpia/CoA transferase-like protein [Wilcoxina mikolae CBS 423.85]|nr:nagb/rpia/CoA transferase-like protein [Wilcoxina mikolae CBS 423.85]
MPPAAQRSPPSSSRSHPKPGVVYSTKGEFNIREHYFKLLTQDPTKSMPIAAIESLSALCDATRAGTIHELMSAIEDGANALKKSIPNAISLTAGCDLFKRFIIAHAHDDPKDFEAFKQQLQANGHLFAQRAREARAQVAEIGVKAVKDGVTVFLHGHSRCVVALLQKAAESKIRFNAIVTETRPSLLGLRTAKELRAAGIPVAVVDDNAMGYALKKAKLVIIGAEGVFGDGSILNILGSYQLALVAKTYNRPVYVATETHKFVDMFPLDQFNIVVKQNIIDFNPPEGVEGATPQDQQEFVDYVPRQLIKGLITEAGLLTPQQVSDKITAMRFE